MDTERFEKMEKETRNNMWNMALALGYMTSTITFMLAQILGIVSTILIGEVAYGAGELIFVSSLFAAFSGFLTFSIARPKCARR